MRRMRAGIGIAAAWMAVLVFAPAAPAQAPALKAAEAPAVQLDRSDSNTLPGGAEAIRFEQEVRGVPVVGAGAVVIDAPGQPAELLFDNSLDGLEAPGEPAVTRAQAIAIALGAIDAGPGGETSARLVIAVMPGNQLAWEVAHVASGPPGDWLVHVSASSGEVIATEDRLLHASGQARLFVPNAVVENNGYDGIRDRGDRDSANLTALRSQVTLEDIKDGQSCLRGAWAHARLGAQAKPVCKDSLSWNGIKRESNKFEVLMAYHHITETQRYFQTLDLPSGANAERQNVLANSFGADQSFYSPGADMIELGSGGVDDGEDGDVIVHEYGHAVQDDQAPGSYNGNQGGAMGEGFGDYLADAYSTYAAGFDPEWTPCVMEWDATSYDSFAYPGDDGDNLNDICLRRADDGDTWNEQKSACGGARNIHCVGEVWASALLDLRTLLDDEGGDSVMDKVVLASHFLVPGNATFAEGAEALIEADENIYGAGDHCTEIRAEMVAREFIPGSFSC